MTRQEKACRNTATREVMLNLRARVQRNLAAVLSSACGCQCGICNFADSVADECSDMALF